MVRLFADENVARQKVERLRELGFEVVSVGEMGLAGQRVPDSTILSLALSQARVVVTHNGKDFKRLHKVGTIHAGILILPEDVRHALLADVAAKILREEVDWEGRIVRLHRPL